MFENAKTGLQHTIPISTNFKLFKYFSMSAGTNINHTWAFNTINKRYDQINQEVITTKLKKFDSYTTYNFSTSIGTTIYGMFDFEKRKKFKP